MTISRMLCVTIACSGLIACDREPAAQAAPSAPPQATPAPSQPAPAAPAPAEVAALGKPAPDFTLTDTEGTSHALAKLRGKTVVLEWFNPDCPFVRFAHSQGPLKDMSGRVARADLVWLSINSGAPGKQGHGADRNKRARSEYAMPNPVLLDESGEVGRAYGAVKTPHLFVIDPSGALVFRGGVDNAPMGEVDPARPRPPGAEEGERVNYVDAALEDMQQRRPLRLADVPPYGCSVKYAS
jgi:peroxiredoxin